MKKIYLLVLILTCLNLFSQSNLDNFVAVNSTLQPFSQNDILIKYYASSDFVSWNRYLDTLDADTLSRPKDASGKYSKIIEIKIEDDDGGIILDVNNYIKSFTKTDTYYAIISYENNDIYRLDITKCPCDTNKNIIIINKSNYDAELDSIKYFNGTIDDVNKFCRKNHIEIIKTIQTLSSPIGGHFRGLGVNNYKLNIDTSKQYLIRKPDPLKCLHCDNTRDKGQFVVGVEITNSTKEDQ